MKLLYLPIIIFVNILPAADIGWDGGAGDGMWRSAQNWQGDVVPQGQDRVFLDKAGAHIVIESGDEIAVNKIIGPCYNSVSTVTLTVSGGVLRNSGYWNLALKAGGLGILNVGGGTVITRDIALAPNVGSAGQINITGGTLQTGGLNPLGNGAVINIHGGRMLIAGDWRQVIAEYVRQGKIKGYGGSADVYADYDNLNKAATTVYSVTSIQNALTAAPQAGGIIYLNAGTYDIGQIDIDKSVTLKAVEGAENTVLNISGNGLCVIADNVVIDGFTIKNNTAGITYLIRVGKSTVNAAKPVKGFTLENCVIQTGSRTDGVSVYQGCQDIEIYRCVISDSINGAVVYGGCSNVSFYDNDIFGNSCGITVLGSAESIEMLSNWIYGNTLYGLRNFSAVCINAENNYWGDGIMNGIYGCADIEPYLSGCTNDRRHLCPQGDIDGNCRSDMYDLMFITDNWLSCNGLDCNN